MFASCVNKAVADNGVEIDNEEQGRSVFTKDPTGSCKRRWAGPLSIVYAWGYDSTKSLLLVALLRAAITTTDTWAVWPTDQVGAMSWAVIMLIYVNGVALAAVAAAGVRLVRRTRLEGVETRAARRCV